MLNKEITIQKNYFEINKTTGNLTARKKHVENTRPKIAKVFQA